MQRLFFILLSIQTGIMGFGFNLLFIFILLPLTAILLVILLATRRKTIIVILGFIWVPVFILSFFTKKKILTKKDYYGSYVVDKRFYPGVQSDWQYNTYRFEIKSNDSIYFHVTDQNQILKTYKGFIRTVAPYKSERLVIDMESPGYHIVDASPTVYRSAWSFYLVFHSDKFDNVFFRKGKWKPLNR